jgi:hypothetical protein
MKDDKYKKAFDIIKVDDNIIENLVNRAYSKKNKFHFSLVAVVSIILSLTLSVTVIASKISTGSFVGYFVDTKGNETLINNNVVDVGQTRISGNYSITLEEVVADDTTIYSLFSVKALDGSPIYPKTYPVPYPVNDNPSYPVNDLEPTNQIIINGGWFLNIDGKVTGATCGSSWLRVDDLSDPSYAEIAMYTQFSSLTNNLKDAKVTYDVNSIGGIAHNLTEKINDTVTIAQGSWRFEFNLNTAMQSNKYTCQVGNKVYDVKITPISMTVYSDETIPFVDGEQRIDNIYSVDFSDGTSAKAIWNRTALSMPTSNAMIAIFNFERIINPENITAIRINNNVYSINKRK